MLPGKPTHQAVPPACALQNASQVAKADASMETIEVVLADIHEGLDFAAEAAEHAGRLARAADLREAASLIFEALRLATPSRTTPSPAACRAGAASGGERF